jgi:hypothetical protein
MKACLVSENIQILEEIKLISNSLQDPSQVEIMNKCLLKFSNLAQDWSSLSNTSESKSKTLEKTTSKVLNSIASYQKIAKNNKLKMKLVQTKEKEILLRETQVASQLSIFPKLWKRNLHKLKRKSMGWRVTPYACPSYDKEFSFLNSFVAEKHTEEEIENVSLEFEKVMQEIELAKEDNYNPDKISIDKSFGGWKSELESEQDSHSHDVSEIKYAISVLQKANLLKPEKRPILSKISQIFKNPENSANLALLLQLISFNQTNQASPGCGFGENDVKIEDILDATSFLSSVGPKALESSLIDLSYEENYTYKLKDSHKKTQSLGKNSTKDMTDKLTKN